MPTKDYIIPFRKNSRIKVLVDAESGVPFVARITVKGEQLCPKTYAGFMEFIRGFVDEFKQVGESNNTKGGG